MKLPEKRDAALFGIPLLLGGLLLAFAMALMNSVTNFERQYNASVERNLEEEVRLAADVLSPMLGAGKVGEAVKYCAGFENENARATLIDAEGKVLGDSLGKGEADNHLTRKEVAEAFSGGKAVAATRYSESLGKWMKYRAVAVGPEKRHVLRLAVSVNDVSKVLLLARMNLLTAFFLGLLISLGVVLYVWNNVRAPLLQLEASVREVAGGNLGAAIKIPATGMFRETAEGVAAMADRMRVRLRELEHVGEFRKDFIANVSHEIKTPLTCILGAAEALGCDGLPEEDKGEALKNLTRNAERLDALVHDILDLSEIENLERAGDAGKAAVDLSAAAGRTVSEMRDRAFAAGYELTDEIEPGVECTGSGRMLEQMVLNLIDNAVKHSLGKHIRVTLKREGGEAALTVSDDGVGIAPEDRARVFERFWRADKSRSRNSGGTGLGLAIVKHIALLHRGRIALESSGSGSAFKVVIPVKEV